MKSWYVITLLLLSGSFNATSQNRDSSNSFLQKANVAKQERRIQLAMNLFEQAVKWDTTNIDALKAMGEYGIESRNYRQAVDAYTRWNRLDPNNESTFQQLATLYFNLGRHQDALSFTEKWEKLHKDKPMHYIAGMSNYYLENYPQAINRLLYAAETDTSNAVLFYTIGRSYLEMERYKQAIPYYQKAANADQKNARYVFEMAMVYYAIPDDKNAIAMFELAAQRGWVQNADYFESVAYCYMNIGNFAKSTEYLQKSLDKRPSSISIRYALAESQYKGGKYQDAIDNWDQILQVDNKNARSLYMIGLCYQKMGQKDKGMALCDKAIEMDPSLNSLKQKKMDMGM
ncbi:MAG: tetratricopeptide repeat protein [Chitinophagaceae bacterium]|nr:tetratricopeptide repeat protein [Chitinophagaceae bacterium]